MTPSTFQRIPRCPADRRRLGLPHARPHAPPRWWCATRLWTADSTRPRAEAMAVQGERIVWVGDDQGAERYIGATTTVVDAKGGLVLPGFIDTHVHPVSGGIELTQCDLNDVGTLDSLRQRVRDCAARTPAGEWIQGGGYQQPVFPDGRPTRQLLDSLTGEHPALLSSSDGHTSWVNSRALALAGVTRATPDPEGGRIDRAADGTPSGTLRERASRLVSAKIPPLTAEAIDRGPRTGPRAGRRVRADHIV